MLRRTPFAFGLAVATMLAGGSCSTKGSAPTPQGPEARFNPGSSATPDFLEVPFPSDAYLVNGKIVDPLPALDKLIKMNSQFVSHELGKADGFSRIALSLFYVDDTISPRDDDGNYMAAKIDRASLPAGEKDCVADTSSVFLIDLEASDPTKARIFCRARFHEDGPLSKSRTLVAVGPARGVVLAEGHKYATVLTSRVKDRSGQHLHASADFLKISGGDRSLPVGPLYADALTKVRAAISGALASDNAEVVAIAPFTTNKATGQLYKLRDALEDSPPQVFAWDAASLAPMGTARFARPIAGVLPPGFTASLDDYLGVVDPAAKLPDGTDDPDESLPVRAHDRIAAIGTAAFEAKNFLAAKGGYDVLGHATFTTDASGNIIPDPAKPTARIWATMFIPNVAMPATGYPTVILQHGLAGSRDWLFNMANSLCAKGWLVVGIDSVTHGARAPEAEFQKDAHTDYEAAPGAKYKGADGLGDTSLGTRNGSFDVFGGLKNLGALRDQLRQAALDTVQLARVLRSNPDLALLKTGVDTPRVDPDRVAYTADSLGGIQGALAASIEPNLKSWVLNVPGGGVLLEVGSHAPGVSYLLGLGGGLNFGLSGDKLNESHYFVTLAQTLIDPGDPLNFASGLVMNPQPLKGAATKARNVLLIEAVYDESVSNEGTEALARAAGIGLAIPNVGSNSEILDIKNIAANPGRVPLAEIAPDAAGAIHDTPIAGVTAVIVQTSPSGHGNDMVNSHAERTFAIPYGRFESATSFPMVDKKYKVRTSYREVQATLNQFMGDAFQGMVPRVAGFKPPVRDVDDDGSPDDQDADPNNPQVK
jgi:hypothetical protein